MKHDQTVIDRVMQLHYEGMTNRQIALEVLGTETKCSTVSEMINRTRNQGGMLIKSVVYEKDQLEQFHPWQLADTRRITPRDNSRVLLISDLHIPYHHPDSFAFLQYLKDKYKPTRVICLGDELDKHAMSYHDHDPDLYSAGHELKASLPFVVQLEKMFPRMEIIESNHGSLVWRKAKTNGIPRQYIKSYNDVLGVGPGWSWHFDLTIDLPNGQKVYIHHGKVSDVVKLSQQMGMNAIQGHYHEKYGVHFWGNPTGLYWGMQCGCLIDDEQYAFSYNNVNIKRPIIGTGLIIDSLPLLEPMVLSEGGRWIGRSKDES